MVSNLGIMNTYSYSSMLTGTGNDKIYVPVKPQMVVYSQLEHISGVAANQNQRGVNISKIQILNSLIERLVSIKQQPETVPNLTDNDPQINTLIQTYQERIHTAIKLAETNPFIPGNAVMQPGAVFSFSI